MTDNLGSRRWKTREGKILTWSQMSIPHLLNASAWLKNSYLDTLNAAYSCYVIVQGEYASYDLEAQIAVLEEEGWQVLEYVEEMQNYAHQRKSQLSNHADWLKQNFGCGHA